MPESHYAEFKLAGETVKANFDFGLHRPIRNPMNRRGMLYGQDAEEWDWSIPGMGWTVDVPVAVKFLDAVGDGKLTAAEARALLINVTDQLAERSDEVQMMSWSKPHLDEGCPQCEKRKEDHDVYVAEWREQWDRLNQPDRYPFAVSRSSVHESACHVVQNAIRECEAMSLKAFTHSSGWEGPQTLPYRALTRQELSVWQVKHTGPKGGRNYKLCRVCAPAVSG